jgi:hypothetical protein
MYDTKATRHGIVLKPIERSLRSTEYLTVDGMNEMGHWQTRDSFMSLLRKNGIQIRMRLSILPIPYTGGIDFFRFRGFTA